MMLAIGAIILVIVAGGGYYAWKTYFSQAPAETPTPETPAVDDRATYASSTLRISLKYPKDYTVDDSFSNLSVNPKKPISGVKFTIPLQTATGTNLSADSGISIEWLPRAKKCTGDIYLAANVRAREVVEGNMTYSVATSSEAGAGNLYEEFVYAISSSSPCTAIRYFIHSTQFANYPPGIVIEFDRAALLADFDKIRQSLVLQ